MIHTRNYNFKRKNERLDFFEILLQVNQFENIEKF